MVSMILAVHGNLSYTQYCIAVWRDNFTEDQYELIVVDDGSADGTAKWLAQNGVRVLRNACAQGLAAARNMGASVAQGDVLLFLEQDTWLTRDALDAMLACLEADSRIGVVGCLSNVDEYGNNQETCAYDGYEAFKAFAKKRAEAVCQSDTAEQSAMLVPAFAMMVTRPAWMALGGFDASIGGRSFGADADFSLRAWQAGYRVVRANGAYVHRMRPVWQGSTAALAQESARGRNWFKQKWGFEIYYSCNVRDELLQYVEPREKYPAVLEVGCACGGNFMRLQDRFPAVACCGIEMNPRPAAVAKCFGQIFNIDVETLDMPEWENRFDAVIMGDVLEHLYDPWQTVRHMYRVTRPGGRIIASIPNITHISIFSQMLRGQWQYVDAGLLDRTHLRFFTQATASALIEQAGYQLEYVLSLAVRQSEEEKKLKEALLPLLDGGAFPGQFDAYQWVVVGRKAEGVDGENSP